MCLKIQKKEFGERENPKFTTDEIDPLLSKLNRTWKMLNLCDTRTRISETFKSLSSSGKTLVFVEQTINVCLGSIQNAEKLKNQNSYDNFELGFGQAAPWRPGSKRSEARLTQIDNYNYINNLLPRISEQKAPEIGHKDIRGLFVDVTKQDELLAQLGR